MSAIIRLLKENPHFFKEQDERVKYWNKVHDSSVIHTRRRVEGDKNPVIDEMRPHETPLVKDYRTQHEKQLTRAGFDMFHTKSSRAISQCAPTTNSISDSLSEYLNTNPFVALGAVKTKESYVKDILLRRALESPNQILLAFPYVKGSPNLPPNNSKENDRVDIKPIIISHSDIRWIEDGCFSFVAGTIPLFIEGSKISQEKEFFFSADKEYWYQHIPYYKKDDKGHSVDYHTIVWYKHDTGESLLNFLPGSYSCSQDDSHEYLDSYISVYFSYADAAMEAFSDELIVNLRYSYPIPEIRPTKCDADGCDEGYIKKNKKNPCKRCSGSGYVLWPGPSGALISPDNDSIMNKDGSSKPAIQWHSPQMGFAKHAYERAFDLLDKAYKSVGLKIYENAGANMSGEGLREMKDNEADMMLRIAQGIYGTWDRFLWHCECLLVKNKEARIQPKTTIPERILSQNTDELRKAADEALAEDKLFSHNNYLSKKYSDNPVMAKGLSALNCYTPYMLLDLDEVRVQMTKNICSKNDMVRRSWGSIALDYVIDEKGEEILDMKKSEIHQLMDDYLDSKDLLEKKADKFTGIDHSAVRVGEMSALINLSKSVQDGSMSEAAAELLLQSRFGFSKEEAERLIEKSEEGDPNPGDAIDDILHGLIVGAIPREDAINQISLLSGKSIEEVEGILKNQDL